MSHEIRTPMNAIIGFTDLSLKNEDVHEARKQMRKVSKAAKNLILIINATVSDTKLRQP
jgi:signal transduction histidine kinase